MELRVAFIGLGAMGYPMAANISKAGFALTVWNRTAAKAQQLAASSKAAVANTPAEAAAVADVILICVPTGTEVRQVLAGPNGILAGVKRGAAVVDCSSIDPRDALEFHALCTKAGVDFLDAPLSGGTAGASAGTLTLMIGGDAQVIERVKPVLLAVGKNLFHMGGPSTGQTTKVCNQMIFGAQMVAVAEAYAFLLDAGIDAKLATDVFMVSTADCTAVRQRVPIPGVQPNAPASNDWKPGFATAWMAKDLHLAEELGRATSRPVLQAALNHQMMRIAMQAGYAEKDISALGKVLQDWRRT